MKYYYCYDIYNNTVECKDIPNSDNEHEIILLRVFLFFTGIISLFLLYLVITHFNIKSPNREKETFDKAIQSEETIYLQQIVINPDDSINLSF